ncbi:Natural resistance-associated macrophage protein [Planctomycetales bacterium 10988]|nr:Natural resistance-associated macrophage protein [Planctomycetales bacterium 10988]
MSEELSKVERDRQLLIEAEKSGFGAKLAAYTRLSGPGWLQSAITLGGGSLASSLYLGVLAGYGMMWLQPLAMILGIVMLSAIAYVTLSTGERPFKAINLHVNPVLGWGWAIATLLANMVWCLPQYALASSVLQQNLFPDLLGPESTVFGGDYGAKLAITIAIFVITTAITWCYDSGSWGIAIYELVLKIMVAAVVVCFVGVVVRVSMAENLDWGAIFAGFIPNLNRIFEPAPTFQPLLDAVPSENLAFWRDFIISEQRDVMIGAAATAVGINMTFLFPYSLLAKGWTAEFRGLTKFDLATGMLIPFLLATSCVVISAANRFHPPADLEIVNDSSTQVTPTEADSWTRGMMESQLKAEIGADAYNQLAQKPEELEAKLPTFNTAEAELAGYLKRRDAFDLAGSLTPLTGSFFANIIFGLGVLGMTLSTITILMLISGFVVCEILNLPSEGWPHRLGTLAAATGVLGPFLWDGEARFYLAVPTSVFGMILLPVAYITFFAVMNQKTLLGEHLPKGIYRIAWNVCMGIATIVALFASLYSVWTKGGWPGIAGALGFLALAVIVHFVRPPRPHATVKPPRKL